MNPPLMLDKTVPPGQLLVVQEFLNSRDLATGADELATSDQARHWLVSHRLVPPQTEVDDTDLRRLVELREALAALVAANSGTVSSAPRRAVTTLNEAARRARLGVRLHPDDGYRLMAEGMGIDRPIGELLGRVIGSMAAGTWPRLKACANPDCGRAFYDGSRNRSARWCSMAVCGNRIKGRSYRRRRAGATYEAVAS